LFTSLLAPLPPADRVRIAEAVRLVQDLGDRLRAQISAPDYRYLAEAYSRRPFMLAALLGKAQ